MTNHPVKFIGPISIRRGPTAHLPDVQACVLALERDLRTAPTPVSGGMRKALHKEAGKQSALRLPVNQSWLWSLVTILLWPITICCGLISAVAKRT